jgi:hypothetical protein
MQRTDGAAQHGGIRGRFRTAQHSTVVSVGDFLVTSFLGHINRNVGPRSAGPQPSALVF